ncbi:uncharacterized protein ACRADG_008459 [Cochliomyia hominivorax]
MLKVLAPINFVPSSTTKCGEIFYHDLHSFSMTCTFCEMKFFNFDEFLEHVQKLHLENYLDENYLESTSINELNDYIEELDDNILEYDDIEQLTEAIDFNEESSYSEEEELLMILNKPKKKRRIKFPKRNREAEEDTNNNAENVVALEIQVQSSLTDLEDSNDTSTINIKKNNKLPEYACEECPKIYPYRKQLEEHVNEIHNGYKCSQCDKRFHLLHHLRRHELLHTTEKFPCPIASCGKIYKAAEYLKRHLEVHTLPRTFVCDYENCSKSFETQTRLNVHKKNHYEKGKVNKTGKKFVCDTCGYICSVSTHLLIHQRRHTGEKPFECEHCEKRFVSKSALTVHKVKHATSRDYVCEICQATFADRRNLKRHLYIHSDERTFQCKFCDKAFKQPHCLGAHIKYVHKIPPKQKQETNDIEIF